MVKNMLYALMGAALGAPAMYDLDNTTGRGRRATARDHAAKAAHDLAGAARVKVKRAAGHAKGILATGRLVGHPKAIEVTVDAGTVRLAGHVLAGEADGCCRRCAQWPGCMPL